MVHFKLLRATIYACDYDLLSHREVPVFKKHVKLLSDVNHSTLCEQKTLHSAKTTSVRGQWMDE